MTTKNVLGDYENETTFLETFEESLKDILIKLVKLVNTIS